MAKYLHKRFAKLEKGKNVLLLDRVSFGEDLSRSKTVYVTQTGRGYSEENFVGLWISDSAKISKSLLLILALSEMPRDTRINT